MSMVENIMEKHRIRVKIPVVFATDENYLFLICVVISSMAESANIGTFYQIYVLVSPDFIDVNHLLDKVQRKYSNINIKKIYIDERKFQNVKIHNVHITKTTFYRLVLCNLIEEDKCIYLDGDIVVNEDLSELYQIDLGKNYLAGCRDIWIDLLSKEDRENRKEITRIYSLDQYVNAGVLLFNLKQIKADGVDKALIDGLQKDYLFEDQDILNVCCYGKIVRLPAKWNLFAVFVGQIYRMKEAGIDKDTLEAYYNRSGIIHYATLACRPWTRKNCWLNEEWWRIAKIWENEWAYKDIQSRVCKDEYKNTWDYYVNLCSKYKGIVILGFTKYSQQLCEWVKKLKTEQEIIFCDNDTEKQKQCYGNISIIGLKEVLEWKKNKGEVLFLIASQKKTQEIRRLLIEEGIREQDIDYYRWKDAEYYQFLDEHSYLCELRDIYKKEGLDWNELKSLKLEEMHKRIKDSNVYQEWLDRYYLDNWLLKE